MLYIAHCAFTNKHYLIVTLLKLMKDGSGQSKISSQALTLSPARNVKFVGFPP